MAISSGINELDWSSAYGSTTFGPLVFQRTLHGRGFRGRLVEFVVDGLFDQLRFGYGRQFGNL